MSRFVKQDMLDILVILVILEPIEEFPILLAEDKYRLFLFNKFVLLLSNGSLKEFKISLFKDFRELFDFAL